MSESSDVLSTIKKLLSNYDPDYHNILSCPEDPTTKDSNQLLLLDLPKQDVKYFDIQKSIQLNSVDKECYNLIDQYLCYNSNKCFYSEQLFEITSKLKLNELRFLEELIQRNITVNSWRMFINQNNIPMSPGNYTIEKSILANKIHRESYDNIYKYIELSRSLNISHKKCNTQLLLLELRTKLKLNELNFLDELLSADLSQTKYRDRAYYLWINFVRSVNF